MFNIFNSVIINKQHEFRIEKLINTNLLIYSVPDLAYFLPGAKYKISALAPFPFVMPTIILMYQLNSKKKYLRV
jgi:hypothetical protein